MRRAHWIGLVAGFALVALLTSGESDFQQPSAAFAYGAMGAGLGYLAGLGVRAVGQKCARLPCAEENNTELTSSPQPPNRPTIKRSPFFVVLGAVTSIAGDPC